MLSPSIGLRFGLIDNPIESIFSIRYDTGVSSEIDISYDPFKNNMSAIFVECPLGTFEYSKDIFFKPTASFGKFETFLWQPEIQNVRKGCVPAKSWEWTL
jgi:hypothetical protein